MEDRAINGDPRISLLHVYAEEWNLQIDDIDEDDAGIYRCFLNNGMFKTITLEVKGTSPASPVPSLERHHLLQCRQESSMSSRPNHIQRPFDRAPISRLNVTRTENPCPRFAFSPTISTTRQQVSHTSVHFIDHHGLPHSDQRTK